MTPDDSEFAAIVAHEWGTSDDRAYLEVCGHAGVWLVPLRFSTLYVCGHPDCK